MISFIREYGSQLAEKYLVCAIAPGQKRPLGKDWPNHPLSVEDCQKYPEAAAGAGIICGKGESPVYAIDIDIPGDAACCAEIRDAVADRLHTSSDYLIYRIGNAPKLLIPVIGEEAGWHKAVTPWFEKGGLRARVEFLGDGQQFVAAAIHPETHQPYRWFGDPIDGVLMDAPEYMPHVTQNDVKEILETAIGILGSHEWTMGEGGSVVVGGTSMEATADELSPQYPMGASIEDAKGWLELIPGKNDYETWLKVGMALHFEFKNRAEEGQALELWNEWSQGCPNYKGLDDIKYRWASFGKRSSRSVTCLWLRYEAEKHKPYKKAEELTELGRAARFADFYRGSLKFIADTEEWVQWDGLRWIRLLPSSVKGLCSYTLGELLHKDIEERIEKEKPDAKVVAEWWRFYRQMQNDSHVKAVVSAASYCSQLWTESKVFDSQPRYLGVQNGVLDLETLTSVEPKRDMGVTLYMGTDYDPDAKCPLWEQTLKEIFVTKDENGELRPDASLLDYIQRYFGYALLGEPNQEIMGIFHGVGSNGKSTLVNTLKTLFGGYGATVGNELVTATGGVVKHAAGGARADLMALRGKRFIMVSEVDQRARLQESVVKNLVSTDEITGRGLYEKRMTSFKPTFVLTMLTNYLPRIDGTDNGIWRRIAAVPFDRNFDTDPVVTKDPDRAKKLLAELPGILNWCLEGVRQYRAKGLRQPDRIKEETAAYKQDMDVLADWLSEQCDVGPKFKAPTNVVWSSWQSYAASTGTDHAISDKGKLTKALKRRGIDCKVMKFDGRPVRCYIGLALSGEGEV